MATTKRSARALSSASLAAAALMAAALPTRAANYTWNSTSSGNWNNITATGWNAATYPHFAGDAVFVSQPLAGNSRSITINVTLPTIGTLYFNNTTAGGGGTWTLSSNFSNPLTFDNGVSDSTLTVGKSSTIDAPVFLQSNLDVTAPANTFVSFSKSISGLGALIIDAASAGNVSLVDSNTYTGGTYINGGTVSLSNNRLQVFGAEGTPITLGGGNIQAYKNLINHPIAVNAPAVLNVGTLTGVLSGSAALSFQGVLTGANTYSGPVTLTFDSTISGNGLLPASSITSTSSASYFTIDNSTTNVARRLTGTPAVTLSNSTQFTITGNAAADAAETLSSLILGNSPTITLDAKSGHSVTLTANSFSYASGALLIRGANIGSGSSGARLFTNSTFPSIGLGTSAITTPVFWNIMVDKSATGSGSSFATYGANGFQPIDASNSSPTPAADANVLITAPGNQIDNVTINTLTFDNSTAKPELDIVVPGKSLTITSGLILSTGTGTPVAALAGGALRLTPNTFNGAVTRLIVNKDLDIYSDISDADAGVAVTLNKEGSGTLTLGGSNTFTGPINITNGTLRLVRSTALPPNVTVSGTLDLYGQSPAANFYFNGNLINSNTTTAATFTGSVGSSLTIGGSSFTPNNNPGDIFLNPAVAPTNLYKYGTGTAILPDTYRPGPGSPYFAIQQGILSFSDPASLGVNPKIDLGGNSGSLAPTLRYTGAGSVTVTGVIKDYPVLAATIDIASPTGVLTLQGTFDIVGPSTFQKTGPGTLVFPNSVPGLITSTTFPMVIVNGGTLVMPCGVAVSGGTAFNHEGPIFIINGGTLDIDGVGKSVYSLSGTGGTLTNSSTTAATVTLNPAGSPGIGGVDIDTFGGNITGNLSLSFSYVNPTAYLKLSGSNSYTGSTTISNGILVIPSAKSLPATTTFSGGLQVELNGSPSNVVRMKAFGSAGVKIDLSNNDAIIQTGQTNSTIRADLKNGLANGITANNTSISVLRSSTAPVGEGLGYATASDYLAVSGNSSFDSIPLTGTEMLLKYTYQGDANLDGRITMDDYSLLAAGFFFHPTDANWVGGDFNYDGVVNAVDYALIDYAFLHQDDGVLANDMVILHTNAFGQSYIDAFNSLTIPEPASLSLFLATVPVLLRRRRP